jgi:undecaprenyl pyrophosphate phosphatase UppP
MDKKSFMKKFAIWTAVVVAVVMLVLGLCFGRVIEETLFGEVMKWVVMTAVIIGIFEVFAYTVGQIVYDIFIRPKNGDYE